VPSIDTQGFWYLPGSKEFHVEWTGVAEILGGLGLTIGGLSSALGTLMPGAFGSLTSDAALFILVLTVLVTPANIYMFTHGAKLPVDGPEVPLQFHAIRLALQSLLFAFFYTLSVPTLNILL
jgi:uncharacterized membrane protein